MTEDTRNVRDAFASLDTSRLRVGTDPDDSLLLERARWIALVRDLRDENAILRGSLELYTHGDPSPSGAFLAFVAGAVTAFIAGGIIAALVLILRRLV